MQGPTTRRSRCSCLPGQGLRLPRTCPWCFASARRPPPNPTYPPTPTPRGLLCGMARHRAHCGPGGSDLFGPCEYRWQISAPSAGPPGVYTPPPTPIPAAEVWAAMLGYSLYLLVGPWCLYTALSGYPLAALFAFGVIGRLDTRGGSNGGPAGPATAGWLFVGTPDTMFVSLVSMLGCVLPATLWVACVVARRLQLQPFCSGGAVRRAVSRSASSESSGSSGRPGRLEAGARSPGGTAARDALSRGLLLGKQDGAAASDPTGPGRFSFSGAQLAALAGLFAFNFLAIYHRAWALMGPSAILASPGLAWTLPLALLLVCAWGGPRRPGGQAAKGE